MRTPLIVPLLASIALLTACNQAEPAPESSVEQTIQLPVDAPKIKLLDAGQGDKHAVKYDSDQQEQRLSIDIADGFEQGTGDGRELSPQPNAQPHGETLKADLVATTSSSNSTERDVAVQFSNPQYSDPAEQDNASKVSGYQFGWTADQTGRITDVRLAAPKDASNDARALSELYLMKLLAQPIIFPAEEIGLGAQWTVENRVTGDSNTLRSTTYTLTSFDPNSQMATLDAVVSERPTLGAIAMETGGELRVTSTESTSNGALTIDLSKPLPVLGEVTVNSRVIYGGGESGKVAVFQDFLSRLIWK